MKLPGQVFVNRRCEPHYDVTGSDTKLSSWNDQELSSVI
jgi:hypothetical protein